MNEVVLLIPAYRPPRHLLDTLDELANLDPGRVIGRVYVVDDGSGSEFRPLFEELSRSGVTVLRHPINLGKGAALKTGFNQILTAWPETAGIVTADADGQHEATDILQVAQALAGSPESVILGVRSFAGAEPWKSRAGNRLTRAVFRFFTGLRLHDTQTGLRGWPRMYCLECLRIPINGYDFELECLMSDRLRAPGPGGVTELPIRTVYRDGNSGSHFSPVRDSMRIYFVFVRYCGAALVAAVLDSAVFFLTYRSSGNLALSQLLGRAAAVAFAFAAGRNLVFRSTSGVWISLARYLTLVTVMGVISYFLIGGFQQRLGMPALAAKLCAEGVLFLANFSLQRQLVFARARGGPAS